MNISQTRSAVLPGLIIAIGGIFIGAFSTIAFNVMADGDPTTDNVPRMLPYQGTLEFNGQPVNTSGDPILMMFSLFDGEGAEVAVYNQAVEIEVFNGRFTTTIGPVGKGAEGEDVPIADIIEAADDLHLGMTILGEDQIGTQDDIVLSNRQRIHATPYAMWATSSTNFNVANNMVVGNSLNVVGSASVGNNLSVTNTLTANTMVANGDLTASGTTQLNALDVTERLNAETGSVRVFGEWQTLLFNTNYTAPADGFVVAYGYRSSRRGHVRLSGYTPGNTLRVRSFGRSEEGDVAPSLMMPVRQGDSWRVDITGSINSSKLSYLRLGR